MSVAEGTDVVVGFISDDVWGYEDELTGVFSEEAKSWGWIYL